jgi:hypothetical protein
MREIRMSGSEGGGAGKSTSPPYLYLRDPAYGALVGCIPCTVSGECRRGGLARPTDFVGAGSPAASVRPYSSAPRVTLLPPGPNGA